MKAGSTWSRKTLPGTLPLILFGAVLLPILAGLVWFVCHRRSVASDIRRLETKARKNGEPITLTELAATYPPVPDSENGAAALMRVWEKNDPLEWKLFRDGSDNLPGCRIINYDTNLPYLSWSGDVGRTNDIPAVSLKAAEDYLREQKGHFEGVRIALSYSNFWFPVKIADRGRLLPHLAEIKREALNFSIEALVASEHGDLDSAVAAIENTAQTGNTLSAEPLTLSQFVRLACYGIALNDMKRLLSRHSLTSGQLNRLTRLSEKLRTPGGLRLAIINEETENLFLLKASEKDLVLRAAGIPQADERLILAGCDQLRSLGDVEAFETIQKFKSICTNSSAAAKAIPSETLSQWLFAGSGLWRVLYNFADFEAHRRAALTALAVEQYRLEHGRFPNELVELVPKFLPAIPSDPYDGKPLKFKVLQTGFVVYSVGSNGIDDGGDEHAHRDETFIVER